MPSLYIVRAQPNPPGRDVTRMGRTTNDTLNREWIEFEVQQSGSLGGVVLSHIAFGSQCTRPREEEVVRFNAASMLRGQRVCVHTGAGTEQWVGDTLHCYLGKSWFIWNNDCGDHVRLSIYSREIDLAQYRARPVEGELIRAIGTKWLEPARSRIGATFR